MEILTKYDLWSAVRHSLDEAIGHLERNRRRMRYEMCLAKGHPIASGISEGACRDELDALGG